MTKTCQVCLIQTADNAMKKCSRCEVACYCSVECQRLDWPEHKHTCNTLGGACSIADTYRKQGYFKKAEKLLLKEEGDTNILNEINAKITLACNFMEQKKNASADTLLRTCLSSLEECDTQGHVGAKFLITCVLCNLGACLNSKGQYEDAILCFEEARALTKLIENQLISTDEQTEFLVNNFFVSTYNLCIALEETGRHEKAFKMLTTVISDMKVEYGDKSPELLKPMFILASFSRRRRIEDFKQINKEAVQLAKELLGSNHLEYLKYIVEGSQGTKYTMYPSYEGEKMDFGLFEEWDEARDVLKETLKKLTKRLGKKHSLTIDCKFELARVLVEKQHFKKAEKYIKECVHYWKTVEAEDDYKKEIRNAIDLLLHLDREWYTIKIMTSTFIELNAMTSAMRSARTSSLNNGQEVVRKNYGDDRKRTMQGYVIDEESLFSFQRDVNEDDGYILSRKSVEDMTKHMDMDDNSLDDDNNLHGVATNDQEDLEEAVKSDDNNVEGAIKCDDNNVEKAIKSDDKEC